MSGFTEIEFEYDADGYRKFDERLTIHSHGRDDFLDAPRGWRGYKYHELPDRHVRLVSLLPGDGYGPVFCETQVHKLDSAPDFEALSYHWGDSNPPAFIRLDGRSLQVTRSLKLALAYLRRKDKARLMWIDAIGIDQSDNTEKAVQVGMMRGIYERSTQTIVWVGESPPPFRSKSDAPNLRAFDLCERIEKSLERVKGGYTTSISAEKSKSKLWGENLGERAMDLATKSDFIRYSELEQVQIYAEALELAYETGEVGSVERDCQQGSFSSQISPAEGLRRREVTDPGLVWYGLEDRVMAVEIASLGHILSRPWFKRVWVLQEVAVARKVIVQCGPAIIDWRGLTIASFVLHRATALIRFGALLANVDLSNVLQISVLRSMIQQQRDGKVSKEMEKELRMVSLVKRYRTWNATNPRDKIYALLGLAPSGDIDIKLDYNRSVEETYQAFATAVLINSHNLDLWTGVKSRSELSSRLPYWAPDWSDTTPQLDLLFNAGIMGYLGKESCTGRSFAASGKGRTTPIAISSNGKFLADGLRMGQITELGDAIDSSKQSLECRWIAYDESDAEDVARSTNCVFRLTRTLIQWNNIVRASERGGKYCTGEKIEKVYRRLLNVDLAPTGCSEDSANLAFRAWQGWLKIVYETLKGLDTLKVDIGELVTGKSARLKLLEEMMDNLEERLIKEGGGYLSALRLAQRDGYLGKLYYAAGAYLKVAKGFYYGRQRRDLNLTLVINNPLACSLEHINQRRLARTDDNFLALVPREAQTGDRVALLDGGAVPFIVRSKGDRWELVGSAYVHGAMYGEQWDRKKCDCMEFI